MTVLKIKSIEKLLGLLLTDLFERFLHRKRRPRIFGHGVRLHFRFNAVHRKHVDLWAGTGPVLFCGRCRLGGEGVWHGKLILVHSAINGRTFIQLLKTGCDE